MENYDNKNRPVPTAMLLGYLVVIYAWLGALFVLILHWYFGNVLPKLPRIVLICLVGAFCFAGWLRKEDFRQLRRTRGRIDLTGMQIFIVTVFVLALSFTVTGLLIWAFTSQKQGR